MKNSKKIIVCSKNPIKLQAVESAFKRMFPETEAEFIPASAPSGVSDQPMSDTETLLGAKNRVTYAKEHHPDADYRIGLEGGIEIDDNNIGRSFGWVAVLGKEKLSTSRTGTLDLPPQVIALIQEGKELGEADDIVFGQSNSKQKMGAVGLLTDGIIDRAGAFEPAIVYALVPHKKTKLYSS